MLEWIVSLVEGLLGILLLFIHQTIDALGYVGIALLMAIESANVPLPSEMILPYAGYLVQQQQLDFHLAALAGAVGCVIGSLPSYWLGQWGGRPFLQRYGKWLLLSERDLDQAQAWTQRYGDWAFFICRMLPIVRTFISLPAGILQARFWPFVLLTFLGSWVWSYGLVYVGVLLGDNLALFKHYWHQFDVAIAVTLLGAGIWYVWHHWQHLRVNAE
jgi:membrane protein DedA with SNARE-associated domain